MTAPGSVELDEDILVVVDAINVLVVLGDNGDDGALLLLGDGLRLDAGLDLAGSEVVDELGNGIVGDLSLLVEGELLVLADLLDGERGELVGLGGSSYRREHRKALASMVAKLTFALVLLSNGLESLGELLSLLRGLGEDVGEGNARGHVSGVGLRADLADKRGGGLDDEGGDVLSDELLREGVLLLVEGLVEDEGRGLDALSSLATAGR